MTYTSGFSGFVSYLPTALALRGFGMAFVGMVVAIAMWGNAIGTLGGGGLAMRVGPFNLFLFGTVSLVAGMVGLTITTWLITSAFIMGVLGSLQPGVVMAAATLSARPENRAVGMGIFYTIYYAGGALVPTLCGMAADYAGAPSGGLWAGAGLSLAAIPTFLIHRLLSARRMALVET
jgi:MFS family permease